MTLFDGSFHEVDSSEMAFKIAGSLALVSACEKADMVLLEPVMKVEVSGSSGIYGRRDRGFEWSSRQNPWNEG